ncbi:hypothetical protein [Acidihalobacter aeolianus]|uniref:hypothetical protein n=1 Tax=Acidihalobacter aeolianus TaxID=2792603 RepID=UPI0012EA9FFB|nr:hypothetical protein [Acidihalobacter aeolianus]
MSQDNALAYPRKVTYNFSLWGLDQPVSLELDGVRYFGMLKHVHAPHRGHTPYEVVLTEVFEHGASRRIPPRMVELSDPSDLTFLHQHGH